MTRISFYTGYFLSGVLWPGQILHTPTECLKMQRL